MNKTTLIAQINEYFATTGSAAHISPLQMRTALINFVNSVPNLEDDAALIGVGVYDPSKTYQPGVLFVYNGKLYFTTSILTGAFSTSAAVKLPLPDAYYQLDQWDSLTMYNTTSVVGWKFRMWKSNNPVNKGNEPGTGSSWDEVLEYSGINYSDYEADRVYKNAVLVNVNGMIYRKMSAGFSTDFGTELSVGGWAFSSVVQTEVHDIVDYTQLTPFSSVKADKSLSAFFPAGAIPIAAKLKVNETFKGGSNTTAVAELLLNGSIIISGNVHVDAGVICNVIANTLVVTDDTLPLDAILRLTVDNDITTIGMGNLRLTISYILLP